MEEVVNKIVIMKTLDVNIHNDFEISIRDLTNDLDISDKKWNSLINLISENSQCVFFYGMN